MHFDGWNTLEGRHLVLIYATVFVLQGGYLAYVVGSWWTLGRQSGDAEKKATRP